eukprot:748519-Hanusia_phi.AAC.3
MSDKPLIDSIESIFELDSQPSHQPPRTNILQGAVADIGWNANVDICDDGHELQEVCFCEVCRPSNNETLEFDPSAESKTAETLSKQHCRSRKRVRSEAATSRSPDGNMDEEKVVSQRRPWSEDEHQRFLSALERFGTPTNMDQHRGSAVGLGQGVADMISFVVGTRSPAQVRSHAQKFFLKQQRQLQPKD